MHEGERGRWRRRVSHRSSEGVRVEPSFTWARWSSSIEVSWAVSGRPAGSFRIGLR